MKSLLILATILTASCFADTFYHFTVKKDNLTCSIDVRVSKNGTIHKETLCFLK